jgi:phosphate-selective porin OprO and OprP
MRRRRTARANSAFLASSSCILEVSRIQLCADAQCPSREPNAGAARFTQKWRRLEGAAWALAAAISLGPASTAFAADDLATQVRILTERLNATTERLNATDNEVRSLKAQLKQYQSKNAKADKKEKEASKESSDKGKGGESGKTAAVATPPPPYLVDVSRGLRIETEDKLNLFRIGGRLYLDGGFSTQPERGVESIANIRQARLDVDGRVRKYWEYRFQYEFASAHTATVGALGGVRDAFIANTYFEPVVIQVGQMFEPYGLEASKSTNFMDFQEKALATEVFGPSYHVGLALLATGDQWTAKGGVFSTSTLDGSFAPAPGTPVPWWVNPKAGWVPTGGAQYFDASGRLTLALVKEDDRLLHIGGSGRYHKPNDSTAGNDARVLQLGSNTQMEANILRNNLLGTPDLSCGVVGVFGNPGVAGKCTHDVVTWGAEAVGAYGPVSVQAEYFGSHYSRDPGSILEASTLGYYAPGGSTYQASGFYVYGTWYLTGESRAAAYRLKALNPANFGQIKILDPVSKGGFGAWEVAARLSEVNLNNGPYQGTYFNNLIALAPTAWVRNYVANASVLGGREEDITAGLNWYPEAGFRMMANWTRVMELSAPWNRAYLNNAHPNTVVLRAQVDW